MSIDFGAVMVASSLSGCQRSAALHPCPSARPGGSKGRGGAREGDHPACTGPGYNPGRGRLGIPGPASGLKPAVPSAREGRRPLVQGKAMLISAGKEFGM